MKKVNNFPHYYITKCGTVFSIKTGKIKVLKASLTTAGYYAVHFSYDAKRYPRFVHRLVAEHYRDDWDNKLQVNHIDGNKLNNDISNLEMCTGKENIHHAISRGLLTTCGECHYKNKLTWVEVDLIRSLRGFKYKELANIFNTHAGTIGKIKRRERWKYDNYR